MPTFNFTQYTRQEAAVRTRAFRPSALPMHSVMRRLTLSYTCTGAEVANDILRIAFPHLANCRLIPELSRITNPTTGGSFIANTKLQKVNTAGTAVDLTGTLAVADNSLAFARVSDGSLPLIGFEDYIQVLITTVASFAISAGQVVILELTLECPEAV